MFSGQPGEYDPALGKVFGMNRAEFEEVDAMRVETENHILLEAANSYRVVCMVRDSIKEVAERLEKFGAIWDGADPERMAETLKEWHDDLEAVTKNG